jgi:hypothetical protein
MTLGEWCDGGPYPFQIFDYLAAKALGTVENG